MLVASLGKTCGGQGECTAGEPADSACHGGRKLGTYYASRFDYIGWNSQDLLLDADGIGGDRSKVVGR